MIPSIKLTYVDKEGVAEPIRLALVLAGIDFEDIRVNCPDWKELKPKTPYGQLPIMEINDNGEYKAHSGAMLRYCGQLNTDDNTESSFLYPNEKMFEIEEAIGLITDLNNAFTPSLYISVRPQVFGYPEGSQATDEGKARTEALRTTFWKEILPTFLDHIEALLSKSGNKWLVSGCDKPTIADCFAVPNLRRFTCGHIDFIPSNCLETHPKVVQYLERFCALPEIQGRYTDGIGSVMAKAEEE